MEKDILNKEEIEENDELSLKLGSLYAKLNSQISDTGDWKIIKACEYVLVKKDIPFDVNKLHEERQKIREEIDTLEKEKENHEKS